MPSQQPGTEHSWWWKVAQHLDAAQLAAVNAVAHNVDDPAILLAFQDTLRQAQAILLEIFSVKGLLPQPVNHGLLPQVPSALPAAGSEAQLDPGSLNARGLPTVPSDLFIGAGMMIPPPPPPPSWAAPSLLPTEPSVQTEPTQPVPMEPVQTEPPQTEQVQTEQSVQMEPVQTELDVQLDAAATGPVSEAFPVVTSETSISTEGPNGVPPATS